MTLKLLPNDLRNELEQRLKELYPAAIKNHPDITATYEKGVWRANVKFDPKNSEAFAQFEYKSERDRSFWHMYQDWND